MKERPILFGDALVRAILDGKKTETRRPLKPQPPSEEASRSTPYSLDPMVRRDIKAYSLNNYTALPKEPGAFDVSGAVGFVRDRCGQTEWRCPFGVPGDRLWVREAWAPLNAYRGKDPGTAALAAGGFYRADHWGDLPNDDGSPVKWRPSIHMPRRMARLLLDITEVRVERLQDISEEGARREGFEKREHFIRAWDGIYAPPPRHIKRRTKRGKPTDRYAQRHPKKPVQRKGVALADASTVQDLGFSANPWVWVVGFKVAT